MLSFHRKVGSDIEEGAVVLKKGTALSAAELAILASIGVCNVSVYRYNVKNKPMSFCFIDGNLLF